MGRCQANRAPLELVDAAIARAKTTRPGIHAIATPLCDTNIAGPVKIPVPGN